MKRTPEMKEIEQRMAPGAWTVDGFLGEDPLGIERIDADRATLDRLGVTAQDLGMMLDRLWHEGCARFGCPLDATRGVRARVDEAKGSLACPFGHKGTYGKGIMQVTIDDKTLRFSPLSIHMIKEHGFFGGIGSPYRVEPGDVAALAERLSADQKQK
jgi:hypothetical protein